MTNVLAIARLTIVEASRRRLLIAIVALTLVVIVFLGWGFQHLTTMRDSRGNPVPSAEVRLITSQLLILVAFMFSGVLALTAVLVASPAISSELESGISLAMLARPIPRWHLVLGKWVGLGALVIAYAAGSSLLAMAVTQVVTGYMPPRPLELVAFVGAEGLTLLSLALLLSTRLSAMTAGVVALMGFFMAWMGGIVGGIGTALDNTALQQVGTLSSLLLPSDGLWRGAIYSMEPAALVGAVTDRVARGNPFFVPEPPPVAYLAWAAFWIAAIIGLTLWSFRRREV